ncbi:MAG: thioesterase [Rhodospirillaceae bacterium]|nr:thioesterase [Rhodospirillaceae bacterium]OUU24179.1 MAG: thioesterase [Candidatus Endolissoclinum sp. TMED37]|tara:strand:- start:97 stop:531 length:435 start_codon:yes stop_codon:yes gene_type:complete
MGEVTDFSRESFKWFTTIPTRWIDMDIYGHVNNVQYYSYFDTAIAQHLIEVGKLDPNTAEIVGLVVETSCTFRKSIGFPANVNAGIRVVRVGTSSVRYEIGLFIDDDPEPAANGYFVHVYVNKETQKPTEIPSPRLHAINELKV